jgi:hypothetical protein
MTNEQATNLIKETFESSFDEDKFIRFIKNLLKHYDDTPTALFSYSGNLIYEPFRPYISGYSRIGKYTDGTHSIDILIVRLKKTTSLERARTMQRNFVSWYLNGGRGGRQKDAALVAFVSPDDEDWRFSLVKMEYTFEITEEKVKVKEKITPARRWSFLVGENEKSHTAQSRFVKLLVDDSNEPTLEQLEEAFNIEPVTKEFFFKYRELFIRTKSELDKIVEARPLVKADFEDKGIDTVNFAKKLLGQIVFLYFLQKKGWFGVPRDEDWGNGSKHFLRELFEKKYCNYTNFFDEILEPLFYEALRIDRHDNDDYYSRFNCKIPFLNGGLFDPINNYNWVYTDIPIPNELFSNTNPTKEGDIGNGILDIFDRYNFTVCEDEPLEKEVAIDPELLGKTYEKFNAIRPDNFDEYIKSIGTGKENKFNKKYGVYYTPPEIVHFMCRQSLIEYLWNRATTEKLNCPITKKDIEDLIELGELITEYEATALIKKENMENGKQKSTDYTTLLSESIRQQAETIDGWLADIAVCDPAVGSGAFPVGMMSEIVRARHTLSLYIKNGDRTSYTLKRSCIENSLYGVDIDAGACEIAKLRLWLSMVVEEDDIKSIKPLPNLDYKIVCGDSLMKVEKELFNNELFHELEKLKPIYFGETNYAKKQAYKRQMDELISQITSGNTQFDFEVYFSEVFHRKKGFDVVIGNPPYIQLQKTFDDKRKYADLYKQLNYETFERTGDIYCLFYEKGITLLNEGGHLAFITSNKWMRAAYGKKLRNYFLKNNPKILIDLGPGVFENATVDTNIFIIQKAENQHRLQAVTITENKKNHIDLAAILKRNGVVLKHLTQDTWFIGSDAEQRLKEKIERMGKPLKDWNVNIYYGIKTGLNEAFIIDSTKRQEILDNCLDEDERRRTEAIIKPILRGRDIKRYYYKWAGLWVIFIPWHFPLHNDTSIQGASEKAENEFIRQYPSVYNHLLKYKESLSKRNKEETGIRYEWYALQRCAATYYPEFEKEKVVWAETTQEVKMSFVPSGIYLQKTCFMITGKNLKYLEGIINSLLIEWYARKSAHQLGFNGLYLSGTYMEKLPIPPITSTTEPIVLQIESLVDKIIAAKKENPKANTIAWEREIDRLVYQLYELTDEEIMIVEVF